MRLTDDIMTSSDECHYESFGLALALAANGRFGLLPSNREFNISINVNKNFIYIETLNCLAITKSGKLIDICYDTSYSNNIDTRVAIPTSNNESFILCIEATDTWKDCLDGFCEPSYRFVLMQENSVLSADMFPLARLVNEYGWRLDETDFLPPCLFTSSHSEYSKHLTTLTNIVKASSKHLFDALQSDCKTAVTIFLPIVEQLRISLDKDIDLMTPMMLLGYIQKYISGFVCACALDSKLTVNESNTYKNFIDVVYSYKNATGHIKEGLNLCSDICQKVEQLKSFVAKQEVKIDAPTITEANLFKKCTNSKVRIPIENSIPGATIYYTIDGSEPTTSSNTGNAIVLMSGFVGGRDKEEADKYVTIKVKAVLNGVSSATNTYKVRLQKDIKHWIEI